MTGRAIVLLALVVSGTHVPRSVAQESLLDRSLQTWREMAKSPDVQKRRDAAWAMAQFARRSSGVTADLAERSTLNTLLADGDPSVRYWAVRGMAAEGQRQGATAQDRLDVVRALEPLLTDAAAACRLAAAEAIGPLGRTETALRVIVASMSDPQEAVRIQASMALERLGPAAKTAESTLRGGMADSSEYVKRICERISTRVGAARK